MPSEKQIEAVQIVLGRYHHFASVAAIREALTAAEQAETETDAEPERKWPAFVYDREAEPNMCTHTRATDAEPFGYWVKHKYAEGILVRTPCFIPEANHYTEVLPLYTHPAEPSTDAEPVLWLHPWNGSTSKYHNNIAADCPKDGPQPIPLYTQPTPSEARLREALEKLIANVRARTPYDTILEWWNTEGSAALKEGN